MPQTNFEVAIACHESISGANADNTTKKQTEQSESLRHFVVLSVLQSNLNYS
ncbi:MAG: hypothetical protein HN778_10880 [Prolixibacteraceae bacterium]|jgi:hypothetical protein|nr:hypothetical protein [Prolixibacteraceae bacterium]MBT6005550.1 hypothetical protein [Prolixibacteraceae bacterium]MBT6763669.1 hypothetical protein [Prolixibacteraceae bacterium]MBT6999565.1 hypothetical protein [Prolixibacteraceae bacterium]MBT7395325.1 hypothetical protein [Prolixibacteraceae bacterium]